MSTGSIIPRPLIKYTNILSIYRINTYVISLTFLFYNKHFDLELCYNNLFYITIVIFTSVKNIQNTPLFFVQYFQNKTLTLHALRVII